MSSDPAILRTPGFLASIAAGDVPGWSIQTQFGARAAADTTLAPAATGGVYPTPTAAAALEIVSNSADDTAAGTGAQSVYVAGVDGNWDRQSETVATNGLSAVALANTYARVDTCRVATAGAYAGLSAPGGSNAGTITLRGAGAGATWAQIGLENTYGLGEALIGVRAIARGERVWVLTRHVAVESAKSAVVAGFVRESADTTAAPFSPLLIFELDRGLVSGDYREFRAPYGPFHGPCDLGFMCAASATTADISVDYMLLVDATP